MQLESIINRPISLCPPSTLAKSTTGEAILFGVCLTGLRGLQGPPGSEPAKATAGAADAAEVTVAGATSSHLSRDGANVGAAANIVTESSGRSRILNGGKCQRHKDRAVEGVWEGEGLCLFPEIFLFLVSSVK